MNKYVLSFYSRLFFRMLSNLNFRKKKNLGSKCYISSVVYEKVETQGGVRFVSGIQMSLKQRSIGSFYHACFNNFAITQNKHETSLEFL